MEETGLHPGLEARLAAHTAVGGATDAARAATDLVLMAPVSR